MNDELIYIYQNTSSRTHKIKTKLCSQHKKNEIKENGVLSLKKKKRLNI